MNAHIETESTKSFESLHGNSGSVAPATQPSASESSDTSQTLVIGDEARETLCVGDLHGHVDRLEALLRQEGVIDYCANCGGSGVTYEESDEDELGGDCPRCEGDGVCRTDKAVEVVLLGDLGHFGTKGSPTGDTLTWHFALKWVDVILWGNHDRAMVDDGHAFLDFHRYPRDVFAYFDKARAAGKLKLAHSSHGYLFTHAGLAKAFRDQNNVDPKIKTDPVAFANWINEVEDPGLGGNIDQLAVRDAISIHRGGQSSSGGILWRDIDEKLFNGFPQVFGHSADHKRHDVRVCWSKGNVRISRGNDLSSKTRLGRNSYCVDVGGKGDKPGDDCLAAIYLPSERIVRVDL